MAYVCSIHTHTLSHFHSLISSVVPPGCALRGQCSQEVPQHCRHGNASLDGQLLMFRHNWMVIFRSLEFPCDGAILNVSMAMNVTVHEEQGIELQTWRFYPNSSLMLVQWAVPRRTECIGCSKNPMYLSEPLSFKKGDALGIYLRTDQTHLHYVHVGSRELPVANTEALLLSVSDVEEIHQAQGKVVTRNFLENRSDGFGQRIFPLSTAYPQIELELSRERPFCVCRVGMCTECSKIMKWLLT